VPLGAAQRPLSVVAANYVLLGAFGREQYLSI
jgi:hypothetical protein